MRAFDFNSPQLAAARPRRDFAAPRSEPAIIGFAAFSLLGAIAMSYYCRMALNDPSSTLKPAAGVAVYEGKAVPRDDLRRPLGGGVRRTFGPTATSGGPDATQDRATARRSERDERSGAHISQSVRPGEPLYSFPEVEAFEQAARLGSASAVAANVSTQSGSGNIEAPDAAFGSFAPVPEPGSWSLAGVFVVLLCALERRRRRRAQRS